MKKGFVIAAGVILAIAAFLRFALVGYSFLAYCLCCAAAVVLIYGFLLRKRARRCIIALSIVLALGFGLFAAMELPVILDARGDRDVDADYVIVLGAGVNGSVPSLSMRNRLDAALEYMEAHPDSIAILTGGQGAGEDISEAQAMYDWLIKNSMDSSRLILEDKATSTEENLKFSFDIIGDEAATATVAVVSSEYHLHRAKVMASMLGHEVYGIPGRTSYPVLMINYFIREAFGMVHLYVYGM